MSNKNIVTNYACYSSTKILTSKIIKETVGYLFQVDLNKPKFAYDAVVKKRPSPTLLFF